MKKSLISITLIIVTLICSSCNIEITHTENPPVLQQTTATSAQPIVPIDPGWKSPKPATSSIVLPSIADVVEKAYPSVVTIATEQVALDAFGRPVTQSGAGSGWILDSKGIIVTNNHVVEGANKIIVQFADGTTHETTASNVFRDPLTDLAIIKVDLPSNLSTLPLGKSSKLRVGDWVVAIGNPLGKGLRAKEGTVSGLNVSLSTDESESMYDLIETSTAINPGNSGGPLLNMQSEVIGITSAKISAVGVEGLGYAISIDSAMPVIEQLINQGYVTRPFLGVSLITVTDYLAYVNRLPVSRGALVRYVEPGSPAASCNLQPYDIVIKYQDQEIQSASELLNALRNSKVGDTVTIVYVRGKNTYTTIAKLIKSPPPAQ